ncbi:hypothetical protein O3M35_009749 [Rhynocoris fuscipes]|uniref:Odorant receptor n=1 Tax=Rhynocoris fuscipes TaxID=488301 RepID=A0AAW1D7N7_9HEMI
MINENRPWSLLIASYHLIIMNVMGIAAVMELIWGGGSLQNLIQALSAFIIYLHLNAKAINLLYYEKEMRHLLNRFETLRSEFLADDKFRHHLIETESYLIKLECLYTFLLMSFPFVSLAINMVTNYLIISEKPHLVFQIFIPWSMKEYWPYLIGMLFSDIISITVVIHYGAMVVLLFTITAELSAFLKIIQARLETQGMLDKETYRQHVTIIQLIKKWNEIYSGQMYFEILVSSLQPCGFGYTLIKDISTLGPGAIDLIYKSFLAVGGPFIVCACGQQVNYQIEKLHDSSYYGTWYSQNPKVRKDLLMMKAFSVQPTTINYRRITTFNYECFAKVIIGY